MKKTSRLLIITMLLVLCVPFVSFGAEGFHLVDSYPNDGFTHSEPINMNVKLWFDKNVIDSSLQSANSKCFSIKSASGTAIALDVYYNEKKGGYVSLMPKEALESDTQYTVIIDKGLTALDGTKLGSDQTLAFKTRDVNAGNKSSMFMMMGMIVVMVGFTTLSQRREAAKKETEAKEKVNPYKVAKEKNVSVEKVIKDNQKAQSKSNSGKVSSAKKKNLKKK